MKPGKNLCGLMLGIFLLVFFLGTETEATLVGFSDRAVWETAAGGGAGDIVDNLNAGSKVAGVIDRGSYTLSGPSLNAFPNGNASTTIDGSGYARSLLDGSTNSYHVFTFSSPIRALGFDINPHSSALGINVAIWVDGVEEGTYSLPSSDATEFRGFVSSTGFTTFTVVGTGASAWHGIDNVEAYAIPEPAAITLCCLFGGGVLGVRRFFFT